MPEHRVVSHLEIHEPAQPIRMTIDDEKLGELADSIRLYGLMLPLVVVPREDGFEIVDGHRRFLACRIVGVDTIPVTIFPDSDEAKWGMMLHANIMREDITPAEEGVQFLELAEAKGWSMPQLQRFFGRSEAYINDRVVLVRDHPKVMEAVAQRFLNWTQAKAIMRCPDAQWQLYLIDQAVTHGANGRTIENMVLQWKQTQLAAAGQPVSATAMDQITIVAPERARCLWCARDDDETNITHVAVHSYHLRDLTEFLERTGVNRPATRK